MPLDDKVAAIEKHLEGVKDDVIDTKQALSDISKDIHIMSQTSVKMETALSKLLESEVRFQLHQQRDEQQQKDNTKLFNDLFDRIRIVENKTETVNDDHKTLVKFKESFWSFVIWSATGIATGIVLAFCGVVYYVAKQGGF